MRILKMLFKVWAIITVISVAGCSQNEPIKVALHDWVGYQFAKLSTANDDKTNFEVVATQSASETIEKFRNQEIDAGYLTFDEVLLARSQGIPLSVLLVADVSAGADVVIARNKINGPEDIIGKTIAYEQTALGSLVLLHFLQAHGLAKNQIQTVNTTYDQHIKTFENSEVDFIITYYPFAADILAKGAHKVFSSREMPDTIVDVLAVNTDMVSANSSKTCQLVEDHLKGVHQYYRNPADSEHQLANYLGVSYPVIKQSLNRLSIPNFLINRKMLSDKGNMPAIGAKLSQLMFEEQLIEQPDSLKNLIDNRCINDILEKNL